MIKDFVIILIILIIIGSALFYIYKNRQCSKCIGCPFGKSCNCKVNKHSNNCELKK